jgi:methionyl-tRNA formyltransferase
VRVAWVSFDVVGRDCLRAAAEAGAEIAAVVTLPGPVDPDRSGQCAFHDLAARLGAELIETADVNDPATVERLRDLRPDTTFVVGWSQLLHRPVLEIPPHGTFGMHPTLLPRHRGRAPIPWTILMGLAKTGVTLFEIADHTADSGPIVDQLEVSVAADEDAGTLYEKLADAHVEVVRRTVPLLLAGTAPRRPQDPRRASFWPKRTPADGLIDWDTRPAALDLWVRAQTRPYPGAFTFLGETKLVVWRGRPVEAAAGAPAGTVVELRDEGAVVACGHGAYLVEEAQVEGREPGTASALRELLEAGAHLG